MKTPSFDKIKELAEKEFLKTRLGIAHLLSAWAKNDIENTLEHLLNGTGIENKDLIQVLEPLILNPQPEDFKLVTLCLIDNQSSTVTGADLFETISKNPTFRICRILFQGGLDFKQLIINLNDLHLEPMGIAGHLDDINPEAAYLGKYTRNLNQLAKDGIFNDLIGREMEVKAITNIMLRRKKCNVILTGLPGIGKTVLVRLLAKKILDGDISDSLKETIILELDIPGVVAGTMYRGQFEERMKKILDAVIGLDQRVILFMDEIHMIIGAGSAKNVNTDGANILKPYLTDRKFSVIGATTTDEYHQYILKDKAFTRRFEQYPVNEPDTELTNRIVRFQAQVLSKYHGVEISDEIIKNAIELTAQHIPNRCQPDKAIDLLDISCASTVKGRHTTLTENRLLSECARITGRDIEYLSSQNKNRLLNLETKINAELIGQKESVSRVCDTIIYRRLGVGSLERPLGVFMLSGKSGIGKTTFAALLARHFYGTPDALLYLDMAEYNEPYSYSKLVGAAPGYVGHDRNPGKLIQWMRDHGSGVILFDEIEKAHPDICQSLLGLLDNGRITSSGGDTLDAKQYIIIATTNAVTEKQLNRNQIGFGKSSSQQIRIKPMLLDYFSNEFLNRFDEILLFNSLGPEELKRIIALRIKETEARFLKKNIVLNVNPDQIYHFLLNKLNLAGFDARGVNKILERELLLPISRAIIKEQDTSNIEVLIDEEFYADTSIKINRIKGHNSTGENIRRVDKC